MKEANKIDMGSIKVHKKVLAEIAVAAIGEVEGVRLASKDICGVFGLLSGQKGCPGISVNVDRNNQVTIEVQVLVRHGLNIPDIARQIQDVIRRAIEKTVDIDLKDVNVNIQGIERGEQ